MEHFKLKLNIQETIKKILIATFPINVEGEVEDFSEYQEIFSDGCWSDTGHKYYYNLKSNSLICYKWNKGKSNTYEKSNLEEYCREMMDSIDEDHFERYVNGIKTIFNNKGDDDRK